MEGDLMKRGNAKKREAFLVHRKSKIFSRKAQVTLFVIIAIIIVVLGLGTFLVYRAGVLNPKTPKEVSEINSYVQSCLDDASKQAVIFMGQQGGYAEPKKYLGTSFGSATYWIYDGIDNRPSISVMQESISQYIYYVLPLCLNSFNQFSNSNITPGNLSVNSTISEDSINVVINYPLEIKKEENSFRLESFSSLISINFLESYNLAIEMSNLDNNLEEINKIDQKELNAVVLQYSEEDYLYIISDNRTKSLGQPFNLVFLIR